MALNLSGTSGITGAGIGTIDASGSNVTGVGTFTQLEVDEYIKHVGDTNTAIRFPTNDSIAFETGGAEKFRVHDTGFAEFAGASDLRVCFGSQGTAGTNDSNWVRADGTNFMYNAASGDHIWEVGGTEKYRVSSAGNATVTGNVIIGTAGKGIDFSAQTPSAVSGTAQEAELLNHYEVGTWTPEYLYVTVAQYGHQSGRYTRVGGMVYCVGQITVDNGLDTSDGSGITIGGLPFVGNNSHNTCQFGFGQYNSSLPQSVIDGYTNVRFNGNTLILQQGNNSNLQSVSYTHLRAHET